MAHRDDVTRVLAVCVDCDSAYAARRWPDGDVKVIGRDGCSCGSTEFEVVSDPDGPDVD